MRLYESYIFQKLSGADIMSKDGMLGGLHDDLPVDDCLRQAVCAAAMCLLDPTTSGGMAPMAQALALGAEFGFRD